MTEITFGCDILYSQLAVFQTGLESPFNDWSEIHIKQGFTWREGSVSFGTLSDNGERKITVRVTNTKDVTNVMRAITVPFYINSNGIEIGSVMETKTIDIEEGMYELLFTIQVEKRLEHYTFSFIKNNNNPKANILVADDELKPPAILLMKAEPAM